MKIELRNVSKVYGSTTIIEEVSLTIEPNEIFFLLGPSGCGKTTLLRMIAGFVAPDSGEILFDGVCTNHLPPEKRHTPMVFQSYALWPHLSVFENVAYGLRLQSLKEQEIQRCTIEALDATRMCGFKDRFPNQLSGGQQQRVAIARALAVNPKALLFDEPLSNLDAKLRAEMRREIRDLHRKLGITILYVTHDQKEAFEMSTYVVVLNQGKIEQQGTPAQIKANPAAGFVQDFLAEA